MSDRENLGESLSAHAPGHIFKSELPEERLKDVFRDHTRVIVKENERLKTEKESFLRVEDYWDDFIDALASPEKWEKLRSRIDAEYPSLAYFSKKADIQQRLAEQLISDGKMTLDALKEKRRQYGSRQEFLGLSGPEGLASAYDLLQREGYEVFYPDPYFDALVKVDLVAFEPANERYYFLQIKTDDKLDREPYLVTTLDENGYSCDKKNDFLTEQTHGDSPESRKLSRDLKTLSHFAHECQKRYSESFVPIFLILPALGSPAHLTYCDQYTGLPAKDFPAIKLPETEDVASKKSS